MINIMAARSKGNLNTSTNALLNSHMNNHNHHPYRVHFTPQLELQDHHQANTHDQMAFGHDVMNHSTSSSSIVNTVHTDFKRKYGGGPYDLANFDQPYLCLPEVPASDVDPSASSSVVQDHHRGMRPPTLNILPSEQMLARHPSSTSTTKVSTTMMLSPSSNGSQRPSELSNDDIISNPQTDAPSQPLASRRSKPVKRDVKQKGHSSSSGQDHPNTPDPKTLRRLAQNREAARKSRLRKKAYVEQLESSSIKLNQLEQELQKFRAQGVFLGGVGGVIGADQGLPHGIGYISSEAAAFNMEYARWLEEHRDRTNRLRAAVDEHRPEDEIRICVENCITHFNDLVHLKSMMVKADVFYIISGMWKTPAEQCLLWIGDFRPSQLIKMIPSEIGPLTDQQMVGFFGLQNLMFEAEEGLSQELKQLNQSLSEDIVSENLRSAKNVADYMGQMDAAMNKLSKLEDIVNQADSLRLQAIHRVHRLMTTRQASRSLIAISEYFHRLRSVSSLWAARSRNP